MQVCSTRDATIQRSFYDSLLFGLPPGGGLYQPHPTPNLSQHIDALPDGAPFIEVATSVTAGLFTEELSASNDDILSAARALSKAAFPFAPVLSWLNDEIGLLELFHGPTCAFKDFGASFLATLLEQQICISSKKSKAIVLVATSGDTGGAVARAFWQRQGIDVILLYPSGRISRLQEQQLAALGENVHALEIAGSFDECQELVKMALGDQTLIETVDLYPANSISLGRLLPQAFYYIFAAVNLRSMGRPLFCVPSGNLGNLTAGIYASKWGLPVKGFIAATNRNEVLPHYLKSGKFLPHPSFSTLSSAMDVGNPSNFERILACSDNNYSTVRSSLKGYAIDDDETLRTMKEVYQNDGRLVDPHTAVGIAAIRQLRLSTKDKGGNPPSIVLATAAAGKFPDTVQRATGVSPPIPSQIQELLERPKLSTPLEPYYRELRAVILEHSSSST